MLLLVNVSVNSNVVNGSIDGAAGNVSGGTLDSAMRASAFALPISRQLPDASLQIHFEKQQSRNRLRRLTELAGNLSVRIEASMARAVWSGSEGSPSRGHRSPADRRDEVQIARADRSGGASEGF